MQLQHNTEYESSCPVMMVLMAYYLQDPTAYPRRLIDDPATFPRSVNEDVSMESDAYLVFMT